MSNQMLINRHHGFLKLSDRLSLETEAVLHSENQNSDGKDSADIEVPT